jgi:hypothetical protein
MRRCAAAALLLGVMATGVVHAAPIQIDDFSKPAPYAYFIVGSNVGPTNPSHALSQQTPSAIGGQRDTLINVQGSSTPNSSVTAIGPIPSLEIDALAVGTNGFSPTVARLQYSGLVSQPSSTSLVNGHNLGGGEGIDLTGGGTNTTFEMYFFSVDAQPTAGLSLAVIITSPGNKTSTANVTVPNSLSGFNYFVPFNKLVGNALLTQVDSISFVLNGAQTPNVDYELTFVAAVPEPGSEALMISAVGSLATVGYLRRWRRRRRWPPGQG